ncbi:MAG: topoisomerase IV, partial [Oscillibacter sp.]|nr:topoisomerase IV [Oscillibacter sp.]
LYAVLPGDYGGSMLFFYENGKAARVPIASYQTTSNRKRLTGAYSDKSPLVSLFRLDGETEIAATSAEGRCVVFQSAQIPPKASRTTQGVAVLKLKANGKLSDARPLSETAIANAGRYRGKTLPAVGALLRQEDTEERQTELDM